MARSVTARQAQILEFIRDFIATHKCAPTFKEIAAGVGLSSLASVHKHVDALRDLGLIESRFNQKRALRLVDGCPACGRVFSGEITAKSA